MKTQKDRSFGVVPVTQIDGEWQVLLVHQISYRGPNDRFWTFPKGHPEPHETAFQTAKRELLEETGIKDVTVVEDTDFTISYSFNYQGTRIDKTVTYFLGFCAGQKVKISLPDEIAGLHWVTFEEAKKKMIHETAKNVLDQVSLYLKTRNL